MTADLMQYSYISIFWKMCDGGDSNCNFKFACYNLAQLQNESGVNTDTSIIVSQYERYYIERDHSAAWVFLLLQKYQNIMDHRIFGADPWVDSVFFCVFPKLWTPPRARMSRGRARSEGAGPRGVSAGRDEKLVPDIYLTIPGSSDAHRPDFPQRTVWGIWPVSEAGRLRYTFSFFCLLDILFPKKKTLRQVVVAITDAAEGKFFFPVSVPPLGCSCRKLEVVNRFLVRARAQSTAGSLHGLLSAGWASQRAKLRA